MSDEQLNVLFLGGLGEVGKNMLVLEYGPDIVIVDAGIGFPEEDMFGVDILLPNLSYLRERAEHVRAVFVTHGHEDHIGALAYLLNEINVPVYSTLLTQGMIRSRLKERGLARTAALGLLNPDDNPAIRVGCFTVECFRVCHSIPDAIGFAVTTPVGTVVITGDFKLDPNPVDGRPTDLARLQQISERRPLLLISDCVHVETAGSTPPESMVENTFDAIVQDAPGRVIVATFASAISRVQQVMNVAYLHDRKVACFGRSLQGNVRVALELGYLNPPPHTLIKPGEAAKFTSKRLIAVCTGSQGEPMAVLSRIASGTHRDIAIQESDTVVVSASPIPGNETSVFRVINELFRRGANVIYPARGLVHVSGHAGREELKQLLEVVRPRYVLPTHGEERHLQLYAQMASASGMDRSRVLLGSNGTKFLFDQTGFIGRQTVPCGTVYLGVGSTGELDDDTIWERRMLARDGMLSVVLTIDRQTGALIGEPDITARGFVPGPANGSVLAEARCEVIRAVQNASREREPTALGLERAAREALEAFVYGQTRRKPVVVPTVIEV